MHNFVQDFLKTFSADDTTAADTPSVEEFMERYAVPRSCETDYSDAIPVLLLKDHACVPIDGLVKKVPLKYISALVEINASVEEGDSITLPPGVFSVSRSKSNIQVCIYHEEQRTSISHQIGVVTKSFTIPMPNLVLVYDLNAGDTEGTWVISRVRYYATNKTRVALPVLNNSTPEEFFQMLSPVPLSNMYGDKTMCYGNNSMPYKFTNDLRGLAYYHSIISIAPFNNDMGIRGVYVEEGSSYCSSVPAWYEFLEGMETFPYEKLQAFRN